jgi:hypothetical protein
MVLEKSTEYVAYKATAEYVAQDFLGARHVAPRFASLRIRGLGAEEPEHDRGRELSSKRRHVGCSAASSDMFQARPSKVMQ